MRKNAKQSEYRKDKIGSHLLMSHRPRTKIQFRKKKGQIKLSERERNQVDLMFGLLQRATYLVKYVKETNLKIAVYIYTLFILYT